MAGKETYIREHKTIEFGSSLTVILTEPFKILGIKKGDNVRVSVSGKKIIIEKI